MPRLLAPISTVHPAPVDEVALVERLRLTLVSAGQFLSLVPAVVLFVLTVVAVPTGLAGVGFLIAAGVVPATALLAAAHRAIAAGLLAEPVPAGYAATAGRGPLGRPLVWLRDPARWRDVGFLAFSATGGAVLSGLPPLLLVTPLVHLTGLLVSPNLGWAVTFGLSLVCPFLWWLLTPPLVRARTLADARILGHARVAELARRVEEVSASRSETLDANAAEVRRIERDLHDGAQARIAAVGMNVGLAEKLLASDPAAAAELLREARETTASALADLRSVVRGIHPPALADGGLSGAVEALAAAIPVPVTLAVDLADGAGELPAPVESAAYFAVAECLANTVKHAGATRAWVSAGWAERPAGRVLLVSVGDDGRGGADPEGSGLSGVRRRLAAFDGSMVVSSPAGGPTVVTWEVPCPTPPPGPR